MIRVLVDGRIDGADGVGRYTRCLVAALRAHAGRKTHVEVLPSTGTHRYGRAGGEELSRVAHGCGADIVHLLDYRIPLEELGIPLVATIHDVLRLKHPDHCYSDSAFATRFGTRVSPISNTTALITPFTLCRAAEIAGWLYRDIGIRDLARTTGGVEPWRTPAGPRYPAEERR